MWVKFALLVIAMALIFIAMTSGEPSKADVTGDFAWGWCVFVPAMFIVLKALARK